MLCKLYYYGSKNNLQEPLPNREFPPSYCDFLSQKLAVVEQGQIRRRKDWKFVCKAFCALYVEGHGAAVVATWEILPSGL